MDKGGEVMPDIRAVRVDSKLIHAKVTAQWVRAAGANLILVASDAASRDSFRQGLMNLAAPIYAQTRYFTVDHTIAIIHKASPAQKIFLITETVQDALRLKQGGVPFDHLTLGDMPFRFGKRKVGVSVFVDDADEKALRRLYEMGVELEIQRTPLLARESTKKLFTPENCPAGFGMEKEPSLAASGAFSQSILEYFTHK